MSEKIVLEVSDELADAVEREYAERQAHAIESMEAHGWDMQAEKVKNTDLAENTAEKALFVLKQEVTN
ncbi:hypothetical protein LPA44_09010 [Halobacterium sp. KA-4]|uniref:hypothetical protein n=1 Tax=Halobacterium sp. KA-4 TaxID=2896367 RepID=UPI001E612BEC|nr:hypothetical protein [Halobacterium sp. KA-4]MCD2200035.1 hypothetical protein [Halobacterium sp. KA-4]